MLALLGLLAILSYASMAIKWQKYSGVSFVFSDYPAPTILIVAMILLSSLLISFWFGWSIRKPKVSGSAPVY
jgi:hypothetical protein